MSSPVTAKTGGLKQTFKPLHLINFKGSKSPNEPKKENKERVVKNKKENAQSRSKGFHLTKPLPTNSHHSSTELPGSTDVSMSPAPLALKATHTGTRSPPSALTAPRALKSAFTTPLVTEPPIIKSTLLSPAADINVTPSSPKVKTLRRVRRLAPARRISFSSLVPPGEDADADGEGDGEEKGGRIELGSAFQLH
jgi:hypothetical protein